jgi:hypothetical protein
MELTQKVQLIMAKVEILKLKADDYKWQCYTPEDTKKQLLETLEEINALLIQSGTPKCMNGHILKSWDDTVCEHCQF